MSFFSVFFLSRKSKIDPHLEAEIAKMPLKPKKVNAYESCHVD